ncbi:MAG: PSD1 domain-containing protein [Verrucomicrobia bacterium]|nr:PSD1 domain-containing protein [Verrucomicrobiota bacterium]MBI3871310.1 PSD1 domain-containing protein [Verrucomicrobiota bacterium]
MLLSALIHAAPILAEPQSGAARKGKAIDFNRDIRPILAENCFACHGPDKNKRKGGLRLDLQEDATRKLESGHRAVVPGDPRTSRLLDVVSLVDSDDRMPPAKTGKTLNKSQIALLRDWISQGAPWKPHWSYVPPEKGPLPDVKNRSWPRGEIDRFILARLEKEGLKPSPEAEKHSLVRRATLDLTGLPPTVAEVDAFVNDKSANAYESMLDRLLKQKSFGERWAQHWLDLARYADSDGYHADVPRSMWQYRDYVIHAFNQDKPFDQFTLEQLAGDLLPNPTLEDRVATAFMRNGMSSTEGGADPDEYANKYVTDRVNTFGTVYLGSSIACTECHDHKYDPFTQREYYQLYDFFNQIPERGLDNDPAPPFIKVPTPENTAALTRMTNEIVSLEGQRKELLAKDNPDDDKGQAKWEADQRSSVTPPWTTLPPTDFKASGGATHQVLEDRSILVAGKNPEKDVYDVALRSDLRDLRAFRIEALTHDSLPLGGASRSANGNFVLTSVELEAESANPSGEPSVSDLGWGNWSILGAFKAANAKEVFEKAFIPEGSVDLKQTHEEGRLKWTETQAWKDNAVQPLWGEHSVTYFYRTITNRSPRYAEARVGTDGGFQAWLNGEKVEEGKVFKGNAKEPSILRLRLSAGENKLLLKAHHGSGAQGFVFHLPEQPVLRETARLHRAVADLQQKDFPASAAIDDKPETGWAVAGYDEKLRGPRQALFALRDPILFNGGAILHLKLKFESASGQHAIGRLRVAATETPDRWADFLSLPPSAQTALFAEPPKRTPAQRQELKDYYRDHFDATLKDVNAKLAAARKSQQDLYASIPTLRVMEDMPEGRPSNIRVRGDYRNKGDRVTAGVPHVLPPLPSQGKTNRLALAQWLTSSNHPLLSRVTVNRLWASLFGLGIVKTGNEFGTQGEQPTHPELLDWMAKDFMDSGWSVKRTLKKIMMSATYRQSSKPSPEGIAKDPTNRLLGRGPRFRLPAETLRDCALDYAGLLDRNRAVGGPSVRPYQPAGLWEERMFGGNRYDESKGEDLYRRSVYTLWKRTVLNPAMMTFDAPDRAICTEQRSMTCTPLQAFVTLNEKGYVEAARMFAARVLREGGGSMDARLRFAYKTVLARDPTETERKVILGVYKDMVAAYEKDLKAALDLLSVGESKPATDLNQIELVAWTAVGNVLLNLDETLTKP